MISPIKNTRIKKVHSTLSSVGLGAAIVIGVWFLLRNQEAALKIAGAVQAQDLAIILMLYVVSWTLWFFALTCMLQTIGISNLGAIFWDSAYTTFTRRVPLLGYYWRIIGRGNHYALLAFAPPARSVSLISIAEWLIHFGSCGLILGTYESLGIETIPNLPYLRIFLFLIGASSIAAGIYCATSGAKQAYRKECSPRKHNTIFLLSAIFMYSLTWFIGALIFSHFITIAMQLQPASISILTAIWLKVGFIAYIASIFPLSQIVAFDFSLAYFLKQNLLDSQAYIAGIEFSILFAALEIFTGGIFLLAKRVFDSRK